MTLQCALVNSIMASNHSMKNFMNTSRSILCVAAWLALIACTPVRSASEALRIQNTEGLWTESLHYKGSTPRFHYFDQHYFPPFPMFFWQDFERTFKVPKNELAVPNTLYFDGPSGKGGQAKEVRIVGPPYLLESRKEPIERPDEWRNSHRGLPNAEPGSGASRRGTVVLKPEPGTAGGTP